MTSKKQAIPDVPGDARGVWRAFLAAIKEDLEILMGRRGSAIKKLGPAATQAEIIEKINEVIDQLQ